MVSIGSHRGFLVVTATSAMAISTLMQYSLSAVGPYIITDLSLSSAAFGSFFTFYFAVCALGSFLLGGPSQRLGPRWGMAMVGVTAAVGFIVAAAAPSLSFLYVALFFSGVGGALSNPATNLTLMNVPSRGTAIGVKQSGVQVSAVLAGVLVAPLAQQLGWRGALLVSAAVALAFVLPALRARTGGVTSEASGAPERKHTASTVGLGVYAFLMGSGLAATITYLPLYANESLGFSTQMSGLLLGIFGICAVGGRVVWGYVSERLEWFARPRVALATMALGALGAALLLGGAGFDLRYLVFPGAILMGLTGASWNGLVMSFILSSTPAASSGRSAGRVQAAFFGGLCLTPVVFGVMIDRWGSFGYAWAAASLIYVVSLVVTQTIVQKRAGVTVPASANAT